MEKKKKKFRFFGMKLKDLIQLSTIIGGCVWGALYLDGRFDGIEQTMNRKFEQVDRRFERMEARVEARFDSVESRLDNIETDLSKTSDLLDAYLTWRFIYVNDPDGKDFVPRYDPRSRTIEFIDRKKMGK